MRAAILGLIVFALGLATAALVTPRAGAHAVSGSISASVGPGFSISMSESSVTAGDYTINVSDNSSMHNFHLSGPGVSESTSISGTGSDSWSVTLQPGTYHFQCDAHASTMNGSLEVTDGSTTTSTTSTTSTTTTTTTTVPTTTAHTTTQRTTSQSTTTTAAAVTTTVAATTTAPETTVATTQSTPTTTSTAPKPLKTRVSKTRTTTKSVSVSVSSNLRGRAVAQLFSGSHRVAEARGTVPGTLVLRLAKPLKAGRYTLKLRVTADGKTSASSRTVTVA